MDEEGHHRVPGVQTNRLSALICANQGDCYGIVCLGHSLLVPQIAFKQKENQRMTTTKSYDYLNRLTTISSQPNSGTGVPPVSFNYADNSAKPADSGWAG